MIQSYNKKLCCRLCVFKEVHVLKDVVEQLKDHLRLEHVQLALARDSSRETEIKTVALCAGSGASLLRGVKADLFITGIVYQYWSKYLHALVEITRRFR